MSTEQISSKRKLKQYKQKRLLERTLLLPYLSSGQRSKRRRSMSASVGLALKCHFKVIL